VERQSRRLFLNQRLALKTLERNALLILQLANQKVKETQRELDSKRATVRQISHEIRTPLMIATNGLDLVRREFDREFGSSLPPAIDDILDDCEEACAVATEIISDFLIFEKLAAGMFTLEKVPTLLVPYLEKSIKMFHSSADSTGIRIAFVQPQQLAGDADLCADIDPLKMSNVVRNLMSNAIKFSRPGGTIRVTLQLVPRSCREPVPGSEQGSGQGSEHGSMGFDVLLAVSDDGAGISKENLGLLFGEGVQFNANSLQGGGGSGFGMYIAKGIVELHGGRIWAESEGEGKGTTFKVQLGVVSDTNTAKETAASRGQSWHGRSTLPTSGDLVDSLSAGVLSKGAGALAKGVVAGDTVTRDTDVASTRSTATPSSTLYSHGKSSHDREEERSSRRARRRSSERSEGSGGHRRSDSHDRSEGGEGRRSSGDLGEGPSLSLRHSHRQSHDHSHSGSHSHSHDQGDGEGNGGGHTARHIVRHRSSRDHGVGGVHGNIESGTGGEGKGEGVGVGGSSKPRRVRVLVVDDSQLSRKMMTRLLGGGGLELGLGLAASYECLEAVDGQAAVDMVRRHGGVGLVGEGTSPPGVLDLESGLGLGLGLVSVAGVLVEAAGGGVGASEVGGEAGVGAGMVEGGIDAVVMDCNMPHMSGPAAARQMRALGYKGIILGVSGETARQLSYCALQSPFFIPPIHVVILILIPIRHASQATTLRQRILSRQAPTALCSSQWVETPCCPHSPRT
jgi:signal transduction histidine kinase